MKNNITKDLGGKFTGKEIHDQLENFCESYEKTKEKKQDATAEGAEGGEEDGL